MRAARQLRHVLDGETSDAHDFDSGHDILHRLLRLCPLGCLSHETERRQKNHHQNSEPNQCSEGRAIWLIKQDEQPPLQCNSCACVCLRRLGLECFYGT